MCNALPVITEAVELLKQRLPREYDGRKTPRLQRLYLLASGRAQSRQDVAPLLGGHRHTMGRWRAIGEAGGLTAWFDVYRPAGQPVSLPPEVLAALEQALRPPAGFASYEALRPWVKQTHDLEGNAHPLDAIVRKRCKAKRTVPRPSHTPKPLTPCPRFKPPVKRSCSASGRLSIPAPCASSAKMNVG